MRKLMIFIIMALLLALTLSCSSPPPRSTSPAASVSPTAAITTPKETAVEPSKAASSGWTLDNTLNMASMSEADISPDGKKVIYSVSRAIMTDTQSVLDSHIYLSDINGENTVQLTKGEGSFHSPQWSPDGKQIAFLSPATGKNEIWLMPAEGGEAIQLTHVAIAAYLFRWSNDGSFISYMAPDPPTAEEIKAANEKDDPIVVGENEKMVRLWTVSTRKDSSGNYGMHQVTNGDYSIYSWDYSPDGKAVTFVRQHLVMPEYEYPATISTLDLKSGNVTDLVLPGQRLGYNHVKYSPDGKWIAYESIDSFYVMMDVTIIPAAGGQPRVLAKDQNESLLLGPMGLLGWSADSKYLYISNARGTKVAITALPADGSAPRDILTRGYIEGGKISSNCTRLGLIMEDFDNPQEVYAAVLDGNNNLQLTRVSHLNTKVPTEAVWKSETVQWKAKDGMTIEGTLTYPAGGKPDHKYPLVVEIHGGPSASFFEYYAGGRSWYISPAGSFAAQGFAVLRPNIRGSSGYGADFTRANYKDWGGKDYEDIIAGVDYLVNRGIADPDRLAIMGQSYGGYMTAWAVTRTSKFKAAATIDGMSDLISDTGTLDIVNYMPDYFGGYFWDNYDLYLSRSPIMQVEDVITPTLILHGQLDQRVPLGQAQEFYNALKLRNVPSKMVIYPRSGHFPGEPKLIRDMWEREINWFNGYLTAK